MQARDAYANPVPSGPVKEVQVIETVGGDASHAGRLSGYITVGYRGATVQVAAQAGIADMQVCAYTTRMQHPEMRCIAPTLTCVLPMRCAPARPIRRR